MRASLSNPALRKTQDLGKLRSEGRCVEKIGVVYSCSWLQECAWRETPSHLQLR